MVLHNGSHEGSHRGAVQQFILVAVAVLALAPPARAAQDRGADPQQQPPIQARPGGPESSPRTDQTVDVGKGTRLVLSNTAGEVVVRSWDRDQVRVQATHSERVSVDIQTADTTLRIRGRAARGPASLIDYQITVPRWMPVNLSGSYLESTIEGTTAEVTVETVHGNVRVVGGTGTVSARSVEGQITIDKASGKVRATTVNEGIRMSGVSGDMSAETTNGDIWIENAQTSSLEVSTVNGDVTFNGTMRDGGAYRLTTHSGDIRVGLGGSPNATVFVRTFQGDFGADFPIQLPEGQSARSGSKRFNFTLGSGSARIELQTFNGDIVVARRTIVSADDARRIRRGQAPVAPRKPPTPNPNPAPKPPGLDAFAYQDFEFDLPEVPELPEVPGLPEVPELLVHPEFDFHFDEQFEIEVDVETHEFMTPVPPIALAPRPPGI